MSIKSRLRKLRSEGHFVGPLNLLAKANYQRVNVRDFLNRKRFSEALSARPQDESAEQQVTFAMNAANGFLRPMQNPVEVTELARRVREWRPKRILEIGTARGGTLYLFCQNAAPDAAIVSLDLPFGINGGGYPEWKAPVYQALAQPDQDLILIRGDSHQQASRDKVLQAVGDEPFDLIMIDADHRYEGVKRDFELYAPLVAPAGVIVLHDILHNRFDAEIQVDRFWNELKQRYETEEIVENAEQGNMGIGIVRSYRQGASLGEPA